MSFFNSAGIEEPKGPAKQDYPAIPKGRYNAVIEKAEVKLTKAGNGKYLNVQYKLRDNDSEYDGRVLFKMFMMEHPNPEVVGIGAQQLAQMIRASNEGANEEIDSPNDLVGRVLQLNVGLKEDGYQGKPENPIYSFHVFVSPTTETGFEDYPDEDEKKEGPVKGISFKDDSIPF